MFNLIDPDSRRDALVTGVGMVTPLGCSADETWRRLVSGERAGRELSAADITHFAALRKIPGLSVVGAPVDHDRVAQVLSGSGLMDLTKQFKQLRPQTVTAWNREPLVTMSLVALTEALQHAGLPVISENPLRTAVVFGSSKGGMRTAERLSGDHQDSPETQDAFDDSFGDHWISGFQPDSATRAISAITGASAASSCPVAACATGLIAALQGAAMIRAGTCDVCIVGSADAALTASVLASFHRLRITSRHDGARTACRPFDETRDGFIVGEGAAVMIVESREHAESRGAVSLARISGGGWLNDPTGLTQVDTDGTIVAELLQRVFPRAGQWPQVINVHGTGTVPNDLAEANGIRTFAGASVAPRCFGVKGAIGHLLGAAGSVETALTILALHNRQIPGTANLNAQDHRCSIPLQGHAQRMPEMTRAAKLSLGFGGHVACGVFDLPSAGTDTRR